MRILTIFGICLLIVTLAVGVDAKDNSKQRDRSSASSRDSRSSSERPSSRSNDRQSSPSSTSSYRPGSSSSSESSRNTYSAYRPGNAATRTEVKPASSGSTRSYSPYRSTGSSSGSTGNVTSSSSTTRRSEPVSTYRPTAQPRTEVKQETRATDSPRGRGLYETQNAYRPTNQGSSTARGLDRNSTATSKPGTSVNSYKPTTQYPSTQSLRDRKLAEARTEAKANEAKASDRPNTSTRSDRGVYSAYNLGGSNNSPSSVRGGFNPGNRDQGNYKPGDRDSVRKPDTRHDDNDKNRSGYKPGTTTSKSTNHYPSTQSIRDRKLAQARMPATKSYKPAVNYNFTYAHYKAPTSYKPPTYKSGRYYYAHKHYTRPCTFGFWSFDYYPSYSRRSIYYHYGLFPYIQITRIIVDSYPTVVYVGQPIYTVYGARYDNDRYPGLDEALANIRSSWVSGRLDLLDRHVLDYGTVAIMLDGRYDYSITTDDYVEMTEDAMGEMDTVSFIWDKVQQRHNGDVTAFATHTYRSGGYVRKVYVSYTLQRIGGRYFISEVGSTQTSWM